MEIRKVQLTGGSSYLVTLPKEWVNALHIKKNDSLGLMVQPDGTLLVTTRTVESRLQRTKEVNVEEGDDPNHLFRILIGAYMMGYTNITVRSPGRMPPGARDTVMKFSQMTVGPEIMEESVSVITIKDLLNPAEMPFDKTVRRMHVLARTMHEDALTALQRKDRRLAEEVFKRDGDVNRLHWLIARQANMMLNDLTMARKMGLSLEEANTYSQIGRIIERIGDHAVRIAKNVLLLVDKSMDRRILAKLTAASSSSLALVQNSLESWFKKDIGSANLNIDSVSGLISLCDEINGDAQHIRSAHSIPVTDIAESVRRTGEYAADISELVINSLVTER